MFESRMSSGLERPKPTVVLDNRFPFAQAMEVGEKGQLDAMVEVIGVKETPDENADDVMIYALEITSAEILVINKKRTV